MNQFDISETIHVGACPDGVIVWTTEACSNGGETIPFEVNLVLAPDEAVKFANAILHAAANLPQEDFSDVPAEYL